MQAERQPPAVRGRRLRIYYASQVESGPPRFRVHVNDRKLIVRDYAYFVENRLRERYRLEGVPLVIDFADRERPATADAALGAHAAHGPAARDGAGIRRPPADLLRWRRSASRRRGRGAGRAADRLRRRRRPQRHCRALVPPEARSTCTRSVDERSEPVARAASAW